MTAPPRPAVAAGKRHPSRMTSGGDEVRPYPRLPDDSHESGLLLAVARALLRAETAQDVRQVLATAVGDLGGALVPARLLPDDALPLDVSLGVGEPVLVVRDPVSVPGAQLARHLPGLVEDARAALARVVARQDADTAVDDSFDAFLVALSHADSDTAHRVVRSRLAGGHTPRQVVVDLLVPAMHRVGELWQSGQWSVADEHAATAVVASCVGRLPRPHGLRHVVVASPEGEWHSLPSQLFAAAVEEARVTQLGPAVPAEDLRRYLAAYRPDVLALSATLPTSLIAAADVVAAAHAEGVPVVCGGAAFGTDAHRATRIGADAWAATYQDLPAHVALTGTSARLPQEAVLLDVAPEPLLRVALARCAAEPWAQATTAYRLERGLDDLRWLARYAAAAHAVDDPTVLTDLVAWMRDLLDAREIPQHVLRDALLHLADAVEATAPHCAGLLRSAAPEPPAGPGPAPRTGGATTPR